MRIGASTFIWVSPFSADTLDLIDKVKAFGFDLIEICVEDPATIDTALIGGRLKKAELGVTVCGAFGPNRDMSSDDPAIRDNAIAYTSRCVDLAAELGSEVVVGPMYAAVGNSRLLDAPARRQQWDLAVNSVIQVADYAAERGVRLALEPRPALNHPGGGRAAGVPSYCPRSPTTLRFSRPQCGTSPRNQTAP